MALFVSTVKYSLPPANAKPCAERSAPRWIGGNAFCAARSITEIVFKALSKPP